MKSSLFVAVALTVAWNAASLTAPASAQELNLGPIIDPAIVGGIAAQQAVIDDINKGGAGSKGGRGSRPGTRGSRPASGGSTRYRPNLAVRRRTVANWMAKTRAANPQVAANLQRDLRGRDPIAALSANIGRYGLRTDDLADVMAVYLVSSWQGIRGEMNDPPLAPVRAARAQMHRVLLSNRRFSSASNATKQQLADALLLQMVVDDQSLRVAKGNPALIARTKNTIRQNTLSVFKIDLSKMKLTNQGFRL